VRHAYEVAACWHEGQWRRSGDPYITHPLAVAEAAAVAGLDCTIAGQLILGLPRLSFMLHRRQWDDRCAGIAHHVAAIRPTRSARKALQWILRSEVRTWALLAPLTAWIVMRTAQGNAGSAVATVITLPPVLAGAVRWLRDWLGITHRDHDNSH
jgi:hypothetical protein